MPFLNDIPPWDGVSRLNAFLHSVKLTRRQRQRVRRWLSECLEEMDAAVTLSHGHPALRQRMLVSR